MEAFIKDPNTIKDFTWDWSSDLADDTIASAQVISDVAGLTISSPTATATHVTVDIGGGVLNTKYRVTCRVTTVGGKIFDKLITILCKEE